MSESKTAKDVLDTMFEYDIEFIGEARLPTIEEMTAYWGTPCADWASGCGNCQAWDEWRMAFNLLMRLSAAFAKDGPPNSETGG